MARHKRKVPPHLAFQTQHSRTGRVNMKNRKPFRTAELKELARDAARKCDDGAYRSEAPVCYHY